jgi:hypothetical protein
MVAGSPDTRFLDFGADRTSQLLFHAGNALLGSNDGVSAAIKELTHGTYDVRVEVAEGEGELFRSADVQLALTALRVAGLDTVGEYVWGWPLWADSARVSFKRTPHSNGVWAACAGWSS